MTTTVLVVDDEPMSRWGIRARLNEQGGFQIIGECSCGPDAIRAIRQLRPAIVFLDVQMSGMTGIEVAQLAGGASAPAIIFVTAYEQYAASAFGVNAVDYLLKPIDDDRFRRALDKAQRLLAPPSATAPAERARRLAIRRGRKTTFIDESTIDWIEASGDYLVIHAGGRRHTMRGKISSIEASLDTEQFARIHRSRIVNLGRIVAVDARPSGEQVLRLSTGDALTASRRYRTSIRRAFRAVRR